MPTSHGRRVLPPLAVVVAAGLAVPAVGGAQAGLNTSGVRCGPADAVASRAFTVRDGRTGREGVVQAVYVGGRRSEIEIRVCRDDGQRLTVRTFVVDAGAPWRELVPDSVRCRTADGRDVSRPVADVVGESRSQRRARIRRAVRRAEARVHRLVDGRHYVVHDGELPVPTSATIGLRRWLVDCGDLRNAR